jgi:hypothetical protein
MNALKEHLEPSTLFALGQGRLGRTEDLGLLELQTLLKWARVGLLLKST